MRPLRVASLSIRSFRNVSAADVVFGERFNVLSGDNGQGKTNVLEALYVVATSRSFRTSKIEELVAFGTELASVRANVEEDGIFRTQSVGLKKGSRVARIDDKRPPSLSEFAVRTPVVVFHPGEIALSMGGSAERRKLLDRCALYVTPQAMEELSAYGRAQKARQRVLEMRGVHASDLGEWEALCVKHGLAVMMQRRQAAERLIEGAATAFGQIGGAARVMRAEYRPSAPWEADAFAERLRGARPADLRRGSASIGPHRDELGLELDGRPVRGIASQGQHRAVTLALKAAEIELVGKARGVRPILLLDDVSSELDRERTAALFAFLREQRGQVFLTTTRPELIVTGEGGERVDFSIVKGTIVRT